MTDTTCVICVCRQLPVQLDDGEHLRVSGLAKELAGEAELHLFVVEQDGNPKQEDDSLAAFSSIQFAEPEWDRPSLLRYFRLNDRYRLRRSVPSRFAKTTKRLNELLLSTRANVVLACNLNVSEYIEPLQGVAKVVDDYDCQSLTIRRQLNKLDRHRLRRRLALALKLIRKGKQERDMLRWADAVTTITPADRDAIVAHNPRYQNRVTIVPNGVEAIPIDRLNAVAKKPARRAIAFWGNHQFQPNSSAIEWFLNEVFEPFLAEQDVHWYIAGRGIRSDLQQRLDRHPSIHVLGFVDILSDALEGIRIMVNPMVMGSGMKNKVLEAAAMGMAIVSTAIGKQGIDLTADREIVVADHPSYMAARLLELLDAPAKTESIAQAAHKKIQRSYSWASAAKLMLRAIERATITAEAK